MKTETITITTENPDSKGNATTVEREYTWQLIGGRRKGKINMMTPTTPL